MSRERTLKSVCAAMGIVSLFFLSQFFAMTLAARQLPQGEYLARAGNCRACHTRKGGKPFAGGLPLESPIGTIYSANITPDRETGIGAYSLEDFSRAVRGGRRKDGVQLYPAMPYPSFSRISDDDIRVLYAYFMQDVKPVKAPAPQNRLLPVLPARWLMPVWNAVFGFSERFRYDAAKSASWNRGAYLVQGLAHCGTCHTPRGLDMAEKAMDEKSSSYLTGGSLGGWYAPSLRIGGTIDPEELKKALKYGVSRRFSMSGPMRDVVALSTQYMTDADIDAIVTYIVSLTAAPVTYGRMSRAAGHYNDYCAVCHGTDGRGKGDVIPRLADNAMVTAADDSNLVRIVFFGDETATTQKNMAYRMPAYGRVLDRQALADILTYIRRSWGNDSPSVSRGRVDEIAGNGTADEH